ncbi:glycosyl hydrolase-related protein [Paenibacillus pasadenensis]|uniref:alpha-mannosidase n=1 Tax=Paenibacillus pasadenensis TaxID=217090 RepID=UPI00203E8984|nr:glycoside hydrolase family 38 C-terminal domain-containing protein [Paenibacillus pasadenensis]MCM3747046.1 glycosyl hydrolase-related protein [Paenibacillus pasadenensis]
MHSIRLTERKIAPLITELEERARTQTLPLEPFRVHYGTERLTGAETDDREWDVLLPGQYWGTKGQPFTMRTRFAVPESLSGRIELLLPLGNSKSLEALSFLYGPEALVFIDGELLIGLAPNRTLISLPERYLDGREHQIALYGWTGIRDERYEMGQPAVVEIHDRAAQLAARLHVLYEAMRLTADAQPSRSKMLDLLDKVLQELDWTGGQGAFLESAARAERLLEQGLPACGEPLQVTAAAVGHGHLDLAWLWTLEQTKEKGARTFANVLRLMDENKSFVFAQSQPQLYRYVDERYPELTAEIDRRVKEGRWEALGGMWVEADCNLSGGEALVRQFMLGRAYYMERFGQPGSPVVWLPDVFGFNAQLPQLMKLAGMDYFVTAKLTWNQYTKFPYDSFWWKGLDGSSILSHLIGTSKPGWWGATYSADLTPEELISTWRGRPHKELAEETLIAFGFGDGGGGPTREMVKRAELLQHHPGLPQVKNSTAAEFFDRLERSVGDRLPAWDGELYFELHRGTYTTQARNKLHNRKNEFLLHDAEFLAAMAAMGGRNRYPRERLREAWELLCLNQFHDIIPGSSIKEVYEQSELDYAQIRAAAEGIVSEALDALEADLPEDAISVVYNPSPFRRSCELIELPAKLIGTGEAFVSADDRLEVQQTADPGLLLAELPDIEPYGHAVLRKASFEEKGAERLLFAGLAKEAAADAAAHADVYMVLENAALRAELDRCGDIVRLYDKRAGREAVAEGAKANLWQAFEDKPLDWDAWDIDLYYQDKMWAAEPASRMEIVESGPLRGTIEIERKIRDSVIVQRISLTRSGAALEFGTKISWNETHVLLKVAFPVRVNSTHATYDIQWGNVERPTHRNTLEDWARFESCAHKWVDLSEGDYGVSLLNDCKYGYDVTGNTIRMTALRSPTFPDPTADRGDHEFVYRLLPHEGDWRVTTSAEAYALNDPLIVHPAGARRLGQVEERTADVQASAGSAASAQLTQALSGPVQAGSFIRSDKRQLLIETVKLSEDDSGIVCRVYENERTRGTAQLTAAFPVAKAYLCDLYETPIAEAEVTGNVVRLEYRPYEILTIKLLPVRSGNGAADGETEGMA